jgi:hypothetical protein
VLEVVTVPRLTGQQGEMELGERHTCVSTPTVDTM